MKLSRRQTLVALTAAAASAPSGVGALSPLWPSNAAAQDGVWVISPRTVPPPAGASPELRESIAATPQPDPKAISAISPRSASDWAAVVGPRDKEAAERNKGVAKQLSVKVLESKIAGVPVFEVTPPKLDPALADKLLVHTHGGAFVLNRGWAGAAEAILIAHSVGIPVLSIDYRMPPEHPFPAAIDDVVVVWRELLKKHQASKMAIGGTSAGGNLAMASVLKFKELKLPLPATVMASTPWADLSKTDDSYFTNEGIDRQLVTYDGVLAAAAKAYANGVDLKAPLVSPVYGRFAGFPPTILFTGTRDLFLSSTARAHRAMRAAGVPAELHVFEAMSHGDWLSSPDLPESKVFMSELAAFLKRHTE